MNLWLLLPFAVALSFILTAGIRRYALARSLLDVPNERSSHSIPTPRGGGVAIVMSFLLGLLVLLGFGATDARLFAALFGAGAIVALIGFLDDHAHIAARWRLLAHFVAAVWALSWLGGTPDLAVLGMEPGSGPLTFAIIAIFLVWLLNLYNFMDGIDGIAGVEAISVCVGGVLIYWLFGPMDAEVMRLAGHSARPDLVLLLLASAVLGFLVWNFPTARIFMGDAGSGFLGIVFGVLSLHAGFIAAEYFWSWVILLGVFIVDASVTLLRRLVSGERVYEAHRTHAYQHAARRFGGHLKVTLGVAVLNHLWLLPVALWVASGRLDGAVGVVVAYTPLSLVAVWLRAGQPDSTNMTRPT